VILSTQISLYPLRQDQLSLAIRDLREALEAGGLQVTPGPMSTLVTGEGGALFDALKAAYLLAAAAGDDVMSAAVSNARHAAAERLDALHWTSILFPGFPLPFQLSIPFGDVIGVRAVLGQKPQ